MEAMEAMEARVQELAKDEGFVKRLLACKDAAEAQELFAEQDIPVSQEDIRKGYEIIKNHAQDGTTELTAEELAQVSGGFFFAILSLFGFCVLALGGVIAYQSLTC